MKIFHDTKVELSNNISNEVHVGTLVLPDQIYTTFKRVPNTTNKTYAVEVPVQRYTAEGVFDLHTIRKEDGRLFRTEGRLKIVK